MKHFEKQIKRALKERPLQKGEKVLVIGELAEFLVKRFIKVPVKFKFSTKGNVKGKYDATIIEWTMDDECNDFLKRLGGKFSAVEQAIKSLKFVSDKEAMEYAKLNKIKFKPRKKDKLWDKFLSSFPGEMKHNLIRNASEMEKLWS